MPREDLHKAIKDTTIKFKGIIFGVDSPILINRIKKQQGSWATQ